MSNDGTLGRAAELRRLFDAAFAAPARPQISEVEELLAIRVADEPFAVRVREIAGVFADRPVTPVPSPLPELLGIAGFRGILCPVYELGAFLGVARRGGERWLLLARGALPVAFAFDALDGHLRLSPNAIAVATKRSNGREHVAEFVPFEGSMRPVVRLSSIFDRVQGRARSSSTRKEQ